MLLIIVFWVSMLTIACWQSFKLLKKDQFKELIIFLISCLLAGIYATLVILHIQLISPFELIIKLFN